MAYDFGQAPQESPFDQMRKRAQDQATAQGQQGMDAITRRYAAMGNLNSGAYTQQLADINRNTQGAVESADAGINTQQLQSATPFALQQKQQDFQGQQAQLGREQQQKQFEREAGQKDRALSLEANQQGLDQWVNQASMDMSRQQMGRTGGLLGAGGFLGTGIGGAK